MKLTAEQKEANKIAKQEAKKRAIELARIETQKSQQPVKEITISIEWKKSRTWGANPHAEASVYYKNGTTERMDGFTASGCGYDKESTVIAEIFNHFLLYKLWQLKDIVAPSMEHPYGVYMDSPYYAGGIGTSCYYRIAEFIGGNFEHVASGKMFDVYKYTE